jgi:hypothetical protein
LRPATLAEKIEASHERCLKALHNSLEHAREAGTLLLEAREKVKDAGQPWLQDNCTCSTSEAFTPRTAQGLLAGRCHAPADVTHLRRKAPEVRLPDGSAEQQSVTSKAKQIARQILALVKKSQLKDGDGGPAQLAVTPLEQLKDSLDASLVVAVEEPESRSEAAPVNRIAGRNGRASLLAGGPRRHRCGTCAAWPLARVYPAEDWARNTHGPAAITQPDIPPSPKARLARQAVRPWLPLAILAPPRAPARHQCRFAVPSPSRS